MKHTGKIIVLAALACISCSGKGQCGNDVAENGTFVVVAEDNPRYFRLSDGSAYIPVGCNIAAISDEEHLVHYMEELHRNNANFARVWLNSDFFEVQKKYGEWDSVSVAHIDKLLELAGKYGIKVKMCIESFRMISPGKNKWNIKASYHTSNGGPFSGMQEYISSEKGKEEYLRRLSFLRDRYGDDPAIFGWELWNEMNAVEAEGIEEWNVGMLRTVHEMFPRNLVMQSLGSLDREGSFGIYEYINRLSDNDVLQVHRYVDYGAELGICRAPVDSLSENAVRHMLAICAEKPVLLAECGAVMPSHTGPHEVYRKDTEGVILHDFLFAPFFCGAAGCGHLWHWDHYIDRQNVWDQIGRFAETVKGIDPAAEHFTVARNDSAPLKVYTLNGKKHVMSWCRDSGCTLETEFMEDIPAELRSGCTVDLSGEVASRPIEKVEIYDPWNDKWTEVAPYPNVCLPAFKHSIVVKITLE